MTGKPTNVRWRIFSILALASFVSYLLRTNVSFAAPAMMLDLGLDEIQYGWIAAAFTAGYAAFQFPGGLLGDTVGPRKALTTIAVLWGVLTILTAIVPGPDTASTTAVIGSLVVVRFLVGAAHAPIFPVLTSSVGRWFPVGSWGLPQGLSSTALTLGAAAAAPLLPWLVGQFGWRHSFLVIAPAGFLIAFAWWWYSRDYPREHSATNEAEIDLIEKDKPPVVEDFPPPPGWIRVLKNRNVLLLALSYACMNFTFYEVFTWFYYYLVEVREFDAQTAGYVNSSQWIAGAAGAAIGGWACDLLCKKKGLHWGSRLPIFVGLILSGVLLIGGAYHSNPAIAVTLLALCFFFNQMTEAAYWATCIAVGGQFAGSAGGVLNTGGNAIGILNALLVAWIANTFDWTIAIASGAGFALLGAILLLFVRPDEPLRLD